MRPRQICRLCATVPVARGSWAMVRGRPPAKGRRHKVLQNLPQRGVFFDDRPWQCTGGLPNIESLAVAKRAACVRIRAAGNVCGRRTIFRLMKRRCFASAMTALIGALCGSMVDRAWGQTQFYPRIVQEPVQAPSPVPPMGRDSPEPARPGQGLPPQDLGRGGWRNLSPEQREAIRRLSREEREALMNHAAGRQGAAPAPGTRLSPQERRQLREQIREEHERRGGGFGRGRRP